MRNNANTSSSGKQASRRTFLKTAGSAVVAAAAGPLILHASDKSGSRTPVVGTGEFKYEVHHNWGELPSNVEWGDTHGVTVDAAGLVYLKHRRNFGKRMDSIVVFDAKGKCVRSFGKVYHGAGHGIDLRREGNEDFLYLCCIQMGIVVKTNLKGEKPSRKSESNSKENRGFRTASDTCFIPIPLLAGTTRRR